MSRTIQMTNADGSPFYANLNAQSRVRITIGEGYTLAASLRETAATMAEFASKGGDLSDMQADFDRVASDLLLRANAIEAILDRDKYAQWEQAAPAWAIRAI